MATIAWAEEEGSKQISKRNGFFESVDSCAQLSPALHKRRPYHRVNSTGSWILVDQPEQHRRSDSGSSHGSTDMVDSCSRSRTNSDDCQSATESKIRTSSEDSRDFTESMVIPRSDSLNDKASGNSSPDVNQKRLSRDWDEILKLLYASGAKSALSKKPNFNTLPRLRFV